MPRTGTDITDGQINVTNISLPKNASTIAGYTREQLLGTYYKGTDK